MSIVRSFKYLPSICRLLKYPNNHLFHKIAHPGIANQKDSFKFSDLKITLSTPSQRKVKPNNDDLTFGTHFSDHMFEVEWTEAEGWGVPHICPIHNLSLHPATKVFHYAQELFEGMKAYRGADDKILLFRPELNVVRMLKSSKRAALPLFDEEEFLKCLKKLISIDRDWVPDRVFCSLYIRPTFIGIEPSLLASSSNKALLYVITGPVGPYFNTGLREPVSLYTNPKYVRAWHGGVGDTKMGANYAPAMYVQNQAERYNHQQVLWLEGKDHQLTEIGMMNVFVYLKNTIGEKELVTPPLNGTILPGIVRQSILDLARYWKEFKVSERPITMNEVVRAQTEDRLLEIFGSGTAALICPVRAISYKGDNISIPTIDSEDELNLRLLNELTDIQIGKISTRWAVSVD